MINHLARIYLFEANSFRENQVTKDMPPCQASRCKEVVAFVP